MTPDVRVENLWQRVASGEVRCKEDSDGSCSIIADGINFKLEKRFVFGRGDDIIFLTYTEGDEEGIIIEPEIHISQAPIGKGLRRVSRFFGLGEFPKSPQTPQAQEDERLRIALVRLNRLVRRRCINQSARLVN